jgi:predicted phage-related endonuclease
LTLELLEEMKSKDIKKIETDDVIISYIDETERETLDSKKLREEYPDIYDECIKFTKVKASVRIKAR